MSKQITPRVQPIQDVLYLPEAAGQTFVPGDLVYLVSGAVTIVAANTTVPFGIAQSSANGTTSHIVGVAPIKVGEIYEAWFAGTLAVADFSASTVFTGLAAGADWVVADSSGDANIVNIVGYVDPIGTVAGRVLITFVSSQFSTGV